MKEGKHILLVFFIAFLSLPFFNQQFNLFEFEAVNDNRIKVDSFQFNIENLDAFPSSYEAYYNDQFSFRDFAIRNLSYVKEELFQTAYSNEIIVGKDGFIFYKDYASGNISSDRMSELKQSRLIEEWKRRRKYLKEKNIDFFWFIFPAKSIVYHNKLPWWAQDKNQISLGDFAVQNIDLNLYYLKDKLIEASKDSLVYLKADTHWNSFGAKIGFNEIIRILKKKYPKLQLMSQYELRLDTLGGVPDLNNHIPHRDIFELNMIERPNKSIKIPEEEKFNFPVNPDFAYPSEFEFHYSSNWEKALPLKVLIIRDSFTEQLKMKLAGTFKETLFIWDSWQFRLNENIIETYQPDLILFLSLESNITHMVD